MNFHSDDFLAKCREQESLLDIIQNEHDRSIGSHEPEDEPGETHFEKQWRCDFYLPDEKEEGRR